MEIDLPSLYEQRRIVFAENTRKGQKRLEDNLHAPVIVTGQVVDIRLYGDRHLLSEQDGWEPPAPALVYALFEQFKDAFPEYNSDRKLAELLGLQSSGDRRIRTFKNGERAIPYGVWRRFLVLTGRVNQEIIPVLAFFND